MFAIELWFAWRPMLRFVKASLVQDQVGYMLLLCKVKEFSVGVIGEWEVGVQFELFTGIGVLPRLSRLILVCQAKGVVRTDVLGRWFYFYVFVRSVEPSFPLLRALECVVKHYFYVPLRLHACVRRSSSWLIFSTIVSFTPRVIAPIISFGGYKLSNYGGFVPRFQILRRFTRTSFVRRPSFRFFPIQTWYGVSTRFLYVEEVVRPGGARFTLLSHERYFLHLGDDFVVYVNLSRMESQYQVRVT